MACQWAFRSAHQTHARWRHRSCLKRNTPTDWQWQE